MTQASEQRRAVQIALALEGVGGKSDPSAALAVAATLLARY